MLLLDFIKNYNPWYETGKVSAGQIEIFRRQELSDIAESLQQGNLITLLCGARRTGKTTLIYQIINDLLKSGVKPQQILFIQGDGWPQKSDNLVGKVIDCYEKYIINQPLSQAKEVVYLFIDEIQAIPDWDLQLKRLFDIKYRLKIIAISSSSHQIRQGARAPLIGRVRLFLLAQLSFYDTYRFQLKAGEEAVLDKLQLARQSFAKNLNHIKQEEIIEVLGEFQKLKLPRLKTCFENYLILGGYPWLLKNKQPALAMAYLKELVYLTIYSDIILSDNRIRQPKSLLKLLFYLILSIGNHFKEKSTASYLGIDRRTLENYLIYLNDAGLIQIVEQFKSPNSKRKGPNKKVCINDNGLINAVNNIWLANDISRQARGLLLENQVGHSLINHYRLRQGYPGFTLSFWRDPNSQKEVDYIYQTANGVLPIEVKGRRVLSEDSYSNLQLFLKETKLASFGLLITDEQQTKMTNDIITIPAQTLALLL